MRISSISVNPEGSQESDSKTIHRDSLGPGSGWAHSSSGQAHD
jgi:hypothetical protein